MCLIRFPRPEVQSSTQNSWYSPLPDLDSSECGPLPTGATPVDNDQPPSPQQSYTYMDGEPLLFSQLVEPNLTESDFDSDITMRDVSDPPNYLNELPDPLHPGWKTLENARGGPCLFRSGADHIRLKDFRHLRRYTHTHIIDQWYFFSSFYSFPLNIRIGTNGQYENIKDEASFLTFLKTERSMIAWNTSQAEIVALGLYSIVLKIVIKLI